MKLFCDWGTSSFRLFLVTNDGAIVAQTTSNQGVSRLPKVKQAGYLREQAEQLCAEAAELSVYVCGMAGSGLGLANAGYQACPTGAEALASHLVSIDVPGLKQVWLVPGLSDTQTSADVMRGEETQLLGWLASDLAYTQGAFTLCLPGTHSKWAQVNDGIVQRFQTAFTGEMYALLTQHSTLKRQSEQVDNAGFALGLAASNSEQPLLSAVFGARAKVLLGQMPAAQSDAFLSGLLIGCEVKQMWLAGRVHIIANGQLSALYQQACDFYGIPTQVHSGDGLSVAGLQLISTFCQ
ncbi:2-dehydro-3-deoxygalactonokinase [Simiduia litorea]